MNLQLLYTKENELVKQSETIKDFRGEDWTFHYVHTDGKIVAANQTCSGREFFPSVFPDYTVVDMDEPVGGQD